MKKFIFILLCFFGLMNSLLPRAVTTSSDIVIYGGTSSGVIAAIQASRMGKSVVLLHPGKHIGGATTNGLGWVDCKNHAVVGGIAKEFFSKVWQFYQNDANWIFEARHPLSDQHGPVSPTERAMWVFEPHVAERIMKAMIKAANVQVVFNESLNRTTGVVKNNQQIIQIEMQSGNIYQGKMFLDCTYEGDLMAAAQVSYTVSREANSLYGEIHNGIQSDSQSRAFNVLIDPYIVKQNATSGLLPRVFPNSGGPDGTEDNGIQSYNYRMCLTDVVANKVMVQKPIDYDESQYEIVFRAIEANISPKEFFHLNLMPNRKTDSNNAGPISTDFVGMSWNWVEADDATRQNIAKQHENWQRGLIWTLQNHPRVNSEVKDYYAPWGLPKDEFIDNKGWPYELYVREGRRMISSYVITENTAMGQETITDSIGLADYQMDSHYAKYYVGSDGYVEGEGGMYVTTPKPFPISFKAVVPKAEECENLLVPVCLSASHVGYGAIRMEPHFMILGQSCATIASLAIDLGCAVQNVPYDTLKAQLIKDGQLLGQ